MSFISHFSDGSHFQNLLNKLFILSLHFFKLFLMLSAPNNILNIPSYGNYLPDISTFYIVFHSPLK